MFVKKICIFFLSSIILFSCLSGCILFQKTEFRVLRSEIIDDDGFTSLLLLCNTSDLVTLKLFSPGGSELYSKKYYKGEHEVQITLAEYQKTPPSGTYMLQAYDSRKTLVYDHDMTVQEGILSITKTTDYWWHHDNTYALVGLNLSFFNQGDFPIYPARVDIRIHEKQISEPLLPSVVLPLKTKHSTCFLYLDGLNYEETPVEITVYNYDNKKIINTTIQAFPKNYANDILYSWSYQGSYELTIPDIPFLYQYYHSLERIISEDYTVYIYNTYDDSYLAMMSERLHDLASFTNTVDMINYIASFVQNLKYAEDDPSDPTCEYPRFPIEMLTDKQGDCEDKAILTAALLDHLAINTSLIRLPNHMAVGVNIKETIPGQKFYIDEYYFLETTRNRWILGKIPDEYQDLDDVTMYPVSNRAVLLHQWKNATHYTEGESTEYVIVQLVVENLGRSTAENILIRAGFFDNQSILYNEETTMIPSINLGEKKLLNLTIDVPQGKSTVLKTRLYLDEIMVHEKESTSRFS